MTPSKYPRVSEIAYCRRGRCRFCGRRGSDTAIVVQMNWLRGDDAVFPVHAACIEGKKVHELLQILIETGTSRKGKVCFKARKITMTTPILTVTVSEDELTEITQAAMKKVLSWAFSLPGVYEPGGPGYKVLAGQVVSWYETFDFAPLIEKLSVQVVEAALREAINKAVQARAGMVLSRMIAEGDLDARIAAIVEQKIAERSSS